MTERLGIVADDLTGAVDTAGVFASTGMSTYVSLSLSAPSPGTAPEVLCVDSGTRYSTAHDAAARVRNATRALQSAGCSRLYKKIDSTLRGHVAVETAAMLDASEAPFALVAPAFPAMGRTQRNGILCVDDTPLAEAVEGLDRMGRAPTSSVVELLAMQTGLRCGLVPLADVEGGEDSVAARTTALLDEGCTVIIFDAITTEHMRRIDAVMANRFPTGLPVGSAGLASAMALRVGRSPMPPVPAPTHTHRPVLIVSGSLNAVSLRQVDGAVTRPDVHEIRMNTDALLDSPGIADTEFERVLSQLQAALDADLSPLLTWVTAPAHEASASHRERSRRLNTALSKLMGRMGPDVQDIGGLVLVWGDTAKAVLTGLGALGISMRSEIMPGISAGTIVGGEADSRPIIAKAGGFGNDDALLKALEYLQGKR